MRLRAATYSRSIPDVGASLNWFVGFIDGTASFVSRPCGGLQRACYNGHKRKHAVNLQSVLTRTCCYFTCTDLWRGADTT